MQLQIQCDSWKSYLEGKYDRGHNEMNIAVLKWSVSGFLGGEGGEKEQLGCAERHWWGCSVALPAPASSRNVLLQSRWLGEKTQGQPDFAIPSLDCAQMKMDRDVVFMFYKAEYLQAS